MPNTVKINLNTIDGETIVKNHVNWTISEYYEKYSSFDEESNYLLSKNDPTLTSAIINANYWFKIQAKNGYKIVRAYLGSSSGSVKKEITDFNEKIYPQTSGTLTQLQEYIYVEVAESVSEYTYTQELEHCKSDYNQSTISEGEHTVIVTADNGYIFEELPTSNMCTFTLNEDRTIATVVMIVIDDTWLKAHATKLIKYYNLTQNIVHCTSNKTDKIGEGNQTIILTAETGFEFKNYGSYKMNGVTHDISQFSDDLTQAFVSIYDVRGDITLELTATKKVEQVGTFVNLYKTNDVELSKLSKARFYKVSGSSTEVVDYGTFIYNLISIPFDIPTDMLVDTATIQLGNYDSNVETTLVNGHILTVNIGNIFIDEKYHNVYDYINTQCFIHLPFVDKLELNTEYVINHTISIKYVIDLYTGSATANLTSDFTNKVFTSQAFEVGYKIPFISEQNNTLVSELKSVIDNNIKTAFIEVVRNIPYDTTTPFGKETIDYGLLSEYSGYIQVNNMVLNVGATNAEKSEIEMILKQGVYIRTE